MNQINTEFLNTTDLPMKLASEMYELTKNLPKDKLYGLKSKASESGVSVPSSLTNN